MLEVVRFPQQAKDIAAGLRGLAQRVEDGEFEDLQFVCALTVNVHAEFTAFAWGECSPLETIGAFARAVARDLIDEKKP